MIFSEHPILYLSIHYLVDFGDFVCYRQGALMNNAAVNFPGPMFSFLLGIYLRVKLLGHMITLLKTLEELPDCSVLFVPSYIPTSCMVGFQFVYILPTLTMSVLVCWGFCCCCLTFTYKRCMF